MPTIHEATMLSATFGTFDLVGNYLAEIDRLSISCK